MLVVKRNGSEEKYNIEKIRLAITSAFEEVMKVVNPTKIEEIVNEVHNKLSSEGESKRFYIESIQEVIIEVLKLRESTVAESYLAYKIKRDSKRKGLSTLYDEFEDIMQNGSKENSNKPSHLINVKRDLMAGQINRYNWAKIISKELLDAHRSKWIHRHDTDFIGDPNHPITNCCVFDLKGMLEEGTKINNAEIEPPKSIMTAANIASQIVANIAHTQYGGISINDFNLILAKYAELSFHKHLRSQAETLEVDYQLLKGSTLDKKKVFGKIRNRRFTRAYDMAKKHTKKEIYDACQLFEYQANSISSANQTPFSTIAFSIPTGWASKEITRAYFEVRMKGLGKSGKIAIFPKLNYYVVPGYNLNPGEKYFDLTMLAAKCISKCFYPDILHVSKEDWDKGNYISRMGCRSKPSDYINPSTGEYMRSARFNWGVTTQNLAKIALEALNRGGTEKDFFEVFDYSADLMEKSILDNFTYMKNMKAKHAPILFQYGGISRLNPDDSIEELLKSKQSSVSYGYFGLDDVIRLLFDGDTIFEQNEFAEKLMKKINEKADEISEKYGIPCSVYGTPFESLIHTAFEADLKDYERVMPGWLKERGYYTNSYHYSSELPINAFDKLEVESNFVQYSPGGNINYSEMGNVTDNIEAIVELIKFGSEIGIAYQAFNVRNDKCDCCGYEGEIDYNLETLKYECPKCGNDDNLKMTVIKRLCGYLSNSNERQALVRRMKEIQQRAIHA